MKKGIDLAIVLGGGKKPPPGTKRPEDDGDDDVGELPSDFAELAAKALGVDADDERVRALYEAIAACDE